MSEKPILLYWNRIPPYAVAAAVEASGFAVEFKADHAANKDYVQKLKFSSGKVIEGQATILKYIARACPKPGLYGDTPMQACDIDAWLDFITTQFVSGPAMEAAVAAASAALALQTFMVGSALSIADICAWGALSSAPMWMKLKKQPAAQNILRWFEFCSAQPPIAAGLVAVNPKVAQANSRALPGKEAAGGGKVTQEAASLSMELPNAKHGAVVTRFPPEPSGYLHIGHTKAALLNQHFADRYGGEMRVRFDDTNPSKENEDFIDSILEDMKRLGLRYTKLTHTSDHFEPMIEMARKLIAAGHLYADDTNVDTLRDERLKCVESKCRGMEVAEVARVFDEMLAGSPEGLPYCLRVKLDMKNDNACLRDPVMYRCNVEKPHVRTGTRFKCYPTYDYACPFVDATEGVTHALRTSEYKDREEQFYRILKLMRAQDSSLPHVNIWDYSRLNFVHTVLSKRKLQKLVDTGVVSAWDDPRFPTVQGVLRRGMQLEALREFILSQGASKNTTLQEWDKIWTINKKVIDPIAPRHTGIVTTGMVPLRLSNGPKATEHTTAAKHKKNPDVGSKTIFKSACVLLEQVDAASISEGEEVTLMDWGNCIVKSITRGTGGAVEGIEGVLHLEGDFKKTKLKLTWLADVPDVVPLRLVDLGHLITKPKLEEDDDFEAFVNRESWQESPAIGDPNMRALQTGDIIQLERKGFFRVDEAMTKGGKPLLLFGVPDGHSKKKRGA